MKLSEIPDDALQEAFEHMRADSTLVDDVAALQRRVFLLEEMVITLANDLNGRLQRRKQPEKK